MLLSALRGNNSVSVVDLGHAKDLNAQLYKALNEALQRPDIDVIVTTGGVSMGVLDLSKGLLEEVGAKIWFGRLRMKPGKPTTFATVDVDVEADSQSNENKKKQKRRRRKFIFALPGNPVSALVTTTLLVCPALKAMAGVPLARCHSPRIVVELAHDFPLVSQQSQPQLVFFFVF